MGHHLYVVLPPSCSWPRGGSRCPSAAGAGSTRRTRRGTRRYCSMVLVMLGQHCTHTPASWYFIWRPKILVPKLSPCIIFQLYGSERSPRLGPVPRPDEPAEGIVLTRPSVPQPRAMQGPERAGGSLAPRGAQQHCGANAGATRSGPWGFGAGPAPRLPPRVGESPRAAVGQEHMCVGRLPPLSCFY